MCMSLINVSNKQENLVKWNTILSDYQFENVLEKENNKSLNAKKS